MSDTTANRIPPALGVLSPFDMMDLADLRRCERERQEARILALETSLASTIKRLGNAELTITDLLDRLAADQPPAASAAAPDRPGPRRAG